MRLIPRAHTVESEIAERREGHSLGSALSCALELEPLATYAVEIPHIVKFLNDFCAYTPVAAAAAVPRTASGLALLVKQLAATKTPELLAAFAREFKGAKEAEALAELLLAHFAAAPGVPVATIVEQAAKAPGIAVWRARACDAAAASPAAARVRGRRCRVTVSARGHRSSRGMDRRG